MLLSYLVMFWTGSEATWAELYHFDMGRFLNRTR